MMLVPSWFAFLLCFVYFSKTASQTLEPNPDDAVNQYLWRMNDGSYKNYLLLALPAASSGKNLFKMRENLSEDTVRTAKAIMSLFVKPSEWTQFETIFIDSVEKTAPARWGKTLPNQVKRLCETVVQQLKTQKVDSATLEKLKKEVELPKPAKNYIWEYQQEGRLDEYSADLSLINGDPQVVKFYIVVSFQPASEEPRIGAFPNRRAAVKALKQMSANNRFKSIVDDVFVKALDNYTNSFIEDLLSHNYTKPPIPDEFMNKVDEDFLKNSQLEAEYKKLKQEAIDQAKTKLE